MTENLMEVFWEERPIAWIDKQGNFTCKNKRLLVKALREHGEFWLAVNELLTKIKND